jgi:hypothetical protein
MKNWETSGGGILLLLLNGAKAPGGKQCVLTFTGATQTTFSMFMKEKACCTRYNFSMVSIFRRSFGHAPVGDFSTCDGSKGSE